MDKRPQKPMRPNKLQPKQPMSRKEAVRRTLKCRMPKRGDLFFSFFGYLDLECMQI